MSPLLLDDEDRAYPKVILTKLLDFKWSTVSAPQLTCDSLIKDKFPAEDMLHKTSGHLWKSGALLHSLMGFKIAKLSAQRSKKPQACSRNQCGLPLFGKRIARETGHCLTSYPSFSCAGRLCRPLSSSMKVPWGILVQPLSHRERN